MKRYFIVYYRGFIDERRNDFLDESIEFTTEGTFLNEHLAKEEIKKKRPFEKVVFTQPPLELNESDYNDWSR